MRALLRRIALVAYVLISIATGLAALVVLGQRGYGPLFHSVGVTTAQIPASVQVLRPDDTPVADLQIECRSRGARGTLATTDVEGRAKCLITVTSEKHFYGVFCVRQTYNTFDFDVFEVRAGGTRRLLKPVEFSRTPRSVAIVCQRQAVAEL